MRQREAASQSVEAEAGAECAEKPHGLGRKQACPLPDPPTSGLPHREQHRLWPGAVRGRLAGLHPHLAAGGGGGRNCQTLNASPGQDTRGSSFDMALFSDRPSASHTQPEPKDTHSPAARTGGDEPTPVLASCPPEVAGLAGHSVNSLGEDRPPSRAEKATQAGKAVAPVPAAPLAWGVWGVWGAWTQPYQGGRGLPKAGGSGWRRRRGPQEPVPRSELASEGWLGTHGGT